MVVRGATALSVARVGLVVRVEGAIASKAKRVLVLYSKAAWETRLLLELK